MCSSIRRIAHVSLAQDSRRFVQEVHMTRGNAANSLDVSMRRRTWATGRLSGMLREAAPRGEDRRGLSRGSLWRSPRAFFHREPPSEPGRESSRASRAGARGTEHPPLLWLVSTAESPTSPTYRGAGLRVGDPFPGGSAMRFREKAPAPGKHEWRCPLNVGRTFICSLTAATAASPSTPMMTFSRQPGSIGYVGSCPDKQVLRWDGWCNAGQSSWMSTWLIGEWCDFHWIQIMDMLSRVWFTVLCHKFN